MTINIVQVLGNCFILYKLTLFANFPMVHLIISISHSEYCEQHAGDNAIVGEQSRCEGCHIA